MRKELTNSRVKENEIKTKIVWAEKERKNIVKGWKLLER